MTVFRKGILEIVSLRTDIEKSRLIASLREPRLNFFERNKSWKCQYATWWHSTIYRQIYKYRKYWNQTGCNGKVKKKKCNSLEPVWISCDNLVATGLIRLWSRCFLFSSKLKFFKFHLFLPFHWHTSCFRLLGMLKIKR